MSTDGNDDKKIENAIEIGKNNQRLIPRVKNWCEHIQIQDVSGGMIAEMYNLPITLKISCPHSNGGFEAMQFEWIARDFIIDNCINCSFHKEVSTTNYGRDAIKKHNAIQLEEKKRIEEEIKKRQALKDEVAVLVSKAKSKSEITSLSILNLIQVLDSDDDQLATAKKIFEASKLSPQFFNETALDSLSIHFTNELIGVIVIKSVETLLKTGKQLSPFAKNRLYEAIKEQKNLDDAVAIFGLIIKGEELTEFDFIINDIVDSLRYKRSIGDDYDLVRSYPNSTSLLINISKTNPVYFNQIIQSKIAINDKVTRININGLLQELLSIDSEILHPHIESIIKSFEFKDDHYEDSADYATCITLSHICEKHSELVLNYCETLQKNLSTGAQKPLIRFYELLLLNEKDTSLPCEQSKKLVDRLFTLLLSKTTQKKLRSKLLELFENISDNNSSMIDHHFDAFLGVLIEQIRDFLKFKWYIEELKKPEGQRSTFNPLLGMDYMEIHSDELELKQTIDRTERVIENLIINDDQIEKPTKLVEVITNLNSKSDGLLKSQLIRILRRSVNDPLFIAELLPSIYNFILDQDSKDVRHKGLNLVTQLIDKNDQLITQTLIDIIKVFMNDIDNGIKAKAFEAYGSIMRKFPDQVEDEQIDLILESLTNKYVIVHKAAVKLAYKTHPFLKNSSQKFTLISSIISLEDSYYKDEKYDYCKELIDILLFLTMENREVYLNIVKKYVVKYCNTGDFYTDKDFLVKLTSIRRQYPELDDIWFKETIGFLGRTKPNHDSISSDTRNNLIQEFYKSPKLLIEQNITLILKFIHQRIDYRFFSDVFDFYSVLSFYSFHKELGQLSVYFNENVPNQKSTEYAIRMNKNYETISTIEQVVTNNGITQSFLNEINE